MAKAPRSKVTWCMGGHPLASRGSCLRDVMRRERDRKGEAPMIHTKAFLLSSGVVGLLLALMLAGCDGDDDVAVTVVNLNILHGFACDPPVPADGDQCRVADRIDLLVQHIAAADCPDVVTLQEHV